MALVKYRRNCVTCVKVRGNQKWTQRIYDATYKRKDGDESLIDIAKELGISKASIYRHSENHIKKNEDAKALRVEKSIIKAKAEAAREFAQSVEEDEIILKQDYEDALDRVIADGTAELKAGNRSVTVNQLLAAIKIKSDNQNKKRGQDVEILKTMYRFGNGLKPKGELDGSNAS